jgi:hypothetical protein
MVRRKSKDDLSCKRIFCVMCPILWHFVYPAYFFSSATPTYWADTLLEYPNQPASRYHWLPIHPSDPNTLWPR